MASTRSGLAFKAAVILALALPALIEAKKAASSKYVPVIARASAQPTEPRGTLKGDFVWAAGAKTLGDAITRWEEFLKRHQPPNGEYQDGFHKMHVDAARLELMRAFYLLGQTEKGDRLLREVNPLGLAK